MADIRTILFVTLSNIGDVVLTLPALDLLREQFPHTKITVVGSQRSQQLFERNPVIDRFVVYDKHSTLRTKLRLVRSLSKDNFSMVIDLANSFWAFVIPAPYKTSSFARIPSYVRHMRDRHLHKVKAVLARMHYEIPVYIRRHSAGIVAKDETYIKELLHQAGIQRADRVVLVACGARSEPKRWMPERFEELITRLTLEDKVRVVLVGDSGDARIVETFAGRLAQGVVNLTGKTTLAQLAFLAGKAALVITNDSAILHVASYMDAPIVAIFGISDETKYGPWSGRSIVVKKDIPCRPCERAQCAAGTLACMDAIKTDDVMAAARRILSVEFIGDRGSISNAPKRILIVRTDRIGDVLLSTPVIGAVRARYPHAYIAMMVAPAARDIVAGNPYLDEVIVFDKDSLHKSWAASMKFAGYLKQRRFDLALVLHPTNRVHLVTFFAGISRRIGYDRTFSFLLTDRIRHAKQSGARHERDYNLDLVRFLGIESLDKGLYMPLSPDSEQWAEEVLKQEGIGKGDSLLAIHPGASCPSKIWPPERFAQVADALAGKYRLKTLIVAGPHDANLGGMTARAMHSPAINLSGRTSVSQLASVLKRCRLFISNDSGPVHVASAVAVPVIAIFGRKQPGLSPRRWGPVGADDRVVHKDAGCTKCLAHDCAKGFVCLSAVTVDDVITAADTILR